MPATSANDSTVQRNQESKTWVLYSNRIAEAAHDPGRPCDVVLHVTDTRKSLRSSSTLSWFSLTTQSRRLRKPSEHACLLTALNRCSMTRLSQVCRWTIIAATIHRRRASKLVIDFFEGGVAVATLSRLGGQIYNFCVAYYFSILRVKYSRNRSTVNIAYVDNIQYKEQGIVFWLTRYSQQKLLHGGA